MMSLQKNGLLFHFVAITMMVVLGENLPTEAAFHADTNYDDFDNYDAEVFDTDVAGAMHQTQTQMQCNFQTDGSQVCDCGFRNEEMILPNFSGNTFQVIFINCKTLRIAANTFAELAIVSWVRFHNIEELILEERSLQFPRHSRNRVQLEFINTVIEEIRSHSIGGNVEQIRFQNTKIGVIQPFAVTGLRNALLRFTFQDTRITHIEPQAFKKFAVEELEIINTEFINDVPSRSFYEIEVTQNFRIRNSTFGTIHSAAFTMHEVSMFSMTLTTIQQFNGESFRMQVRDGITIRNNTFVVMNSGAFRSIQVDGNYFARNSEPMAFHFISNQLETTGGPQTIDFDPQFNMRISQISFTSSLTCQKLDQLRNNQFLLSYADTIYFRMSNNLESSSSSLNEGEFLTFAYIVNHKCVEQSYLLYIIIGVSVLIGLILIVLTVILIIWLRRRRARQMNIIRPEGKTYRETQIIMQIENHGLLKTDL